ncbi:hypothetical protein B9Z55_003563 [Caenorhabditis nigoni]|uniref:Uncharacterized protein n=1 Tax=Caenorhabditis nigoni TaxID=1611254 RepID=A0A2G5VRG8_9PELO|nr:hypothetical protein B9Z55_003563 [Caenorhabditis nigoni]
MRMIKNCSKFKYRRRPPAASQRKLGPPTRPSGGAGERAWCEKYFPNTTLPYLKFRSLIMPRPLSFF